MAGIKPFQIAVPEGDIELLKKKLALAKFPDELENVDWQLGTPLADVRRLTSYWRDRYDWRKHEAELNKIPQFTTTVDVPDFGQLSIHFAYQRSSVEGAVPLLFLHGCKMWNCSPPQRTGRR